MKQIICVTNRHLVEGDFLLHMAKVVERKDTPAAIILREKDLPEEEYEKLAVQMQQICEDKIPLIIHNFPAVAARLGIPRIHLPLAILEQMKEEDKKQFETIGVSTHSVEQAVKAQKLGATYITAGHVFRTECKKGVPERGLDFLEQVCQSVTIPVYAIGGLDKERIFQCTDRGAAGGCIMSGFMS